MVPCATWSPTFSTIRHSRNATNSPHWIARTNWNSEKIPIRFPASFSRTDRGEYAPQYRGGRGRATAHHHVHRNNVGDAPATGVALAEDATIAGAIADRRSEEHTSELQS